MVGADYDLTSEVARIADHNVTGIRDEPNAVRRGVR